MSAKKLVDISDRQKAILLAVIKEYIDSAGDVGSEMLANKYSLGVSSATIRNEMVRLMKSGFLVKNHISAGRLPTDTALRYYVNEILDSIELDAIRQTKIRQGLFGVRFDPEKLIKTILQTLVNYSGSAGFIVLDDMTRYYGVSSLIEYEDLKNIDTMQRILDTLEDENLLKAVFSKYDDDHVKVLIGSELGIKNLEGCTIIFTKFDFWQDRSGHLGILGSRRLDYEKAIPVVRAVRDTVYESLKGWN